MRVGIRSSLPFVGAAIFTVLVLVLLAFSCSSGPSFDYEGRWEGHRKLDRPGVDPSVTYTLGKVTLSIHGNRYDMTSEGIPTSGTIARSDGHLLLRANTIMGVPINREGGDPAVNHPDVTVVGQPDGRLVLDDPKAIDGTPVTLSRAAK